MSDFINKKIIFLIISVYLSMQKVQIETQIKDNSLYFDDLLV